MTTETQDKQNGKHKGATIAGAAAGIGVAAAAGAFAYRKLRTKGTSAGPDHAVAIDGSDSSAEMRARIADENMIPTA